MDDNDESQNSVANLSIENDDYKEQNAMIKELGIFYEKFAMKMEAFDPMDRPLPSEDDDQAIKRDALVHKIEVEMAEHAIRSIDLNAPMSNESHIILMEMFTQTNKECQFIGDQYIDSAKQLGDQFMDKYADNEKVKSYLRVLQFFAHNKMIKEAELMLATFVGYIDKTEQMMQMEREFNQKDKIDVHLNQAIRNMIVRNN